MNDEPTPEQKQAAKDVLDKPEHKYTPDHTGKDPRDEQTKDDPVPEDAQ